MFPPVKGLTIRQNEAIYTTTQADPVPGSARAGCAQLRSRLRPGPDLNQTFDSIITPDASSVCHSSRWQNYRTSRRQMMRNASSPQPYSRAESSMICTCPQDSPAQTRYPAPNVSSVCKFCECKWPYRTARCFPKLEITHIPWKV